MSAAPDTPTTTATSLSLRVRSEQLRIFFDASRRTAWPALLLGVLCVLALSHAVERALLGGWLLLLLACYQVRSVLSRTQVPAQPTHEQLRRLQNRAIFGAALTGTAWGVLMSLPALQRFDHLLFLGFLVGGVTASATPSLGAHPRAAYAFVVPCVLPLGVRLLLDGSPLGLASAGMILLYLGVVYLTVRRIGHGLEQAVQLRIHADAQNVALAHSRAELQRHERLMAIGSEAQGDFIRGLATEQLLRKLLDSLLELTGMQLGALIAAQEPNQQGPTLGLWALRSEPPRELPPLDPELQRCLVAAMAPAQPLFCAADHLLCQGLQLSGLRPAGLMVLPLHVGDSMMGVIALASEATHPDTVLANFLQPLTTTLAHMLLARRADQQRRDADQRLERTRAQLQICVADTPAAVAMLDRELRLVACSQRWLSDFGVVAQQVQGRQLYELVPEIPVRWRASFARVVAGHLEINEEDPFVRGDGTVRWLRWQSRPWYEPDGRVGGLVLFSEDVTAQKKTNDALCARERLLEQLTDRVPGLLFQMRQHADGHRSLLYVSSGSLRVLRMTPDVLIDNPQRIFDICYPPDRELLDAVLMKADVTGLLQVSFRTQCPNGEIRWLSMHADATRLADASTIWHGYIEDISERVYMQDKCPMVKEKHGIAPHRNEPQQSCAERCPTLNDRHSRVTMLEVSP